jgi:ParB family chromosome partitioning protein
MSYDEIARRRGVTVREVERFVPRWMAFPPGAYTERGGVATVSRAAAVEGLFALPADDEAAPEPQPNAEAVDSIEPVAEAA